MAKPQPFEIIIEGRTYEVTAESWYRARELARVEHSRRRSFDEVCHRLSAHWVRQHSARCERLWRSKQ